MRISVNKVGSVQFSYPRSANELAIDVEATGTPRGLPPGSGLHLEVQKADPSAPGGDVLIRFSAHRGTDGAWRALEAALSDALQRLRAMDGDAIPRVDIRLPKQAFGGDPDPGTDVRSPTGGGGPAVV